MDKGWLKGHFLNVINDNLILAQVFIVIFFFEDYLIITQNTSLLQIKLDFDSITPQHFIFFFVFIAVSKATWFVWHLLVMLVKSALKCYGTNEVYEKISFTAFVLCILITAYIFCINHYYQSLSPISVTKHPHWHSFFLLVLILPAFICGFISFFSVRPDEDIKKTST